MTRHVVIGERHGAQRSAAWSTGIFLLAFCVRLGFQAGFVGMQAPPRDDASQYDDIARSLSRGGPYVTNDGLRSTRAPAYPILLAGIYRIFGADWAAGRIGQAVIGASVCPILLQMGARFFGFPAGLLASLTCAIFPYTVFWAGYLLSEPLCVLFVTASTWALLAAEDDWRLTGLWSLLCALAALARPNMGLLLPLGLVWSLRDRSRRWRRCALALAVFGLVLLPWTLRNYTIHHQLVPITTMGGVVLWEGNNPYVAATPGMLGRSAHAPSLPEARLVSGLPEAEADSVYLGLGLRFMREHWQEMPRLVTWKFMRLWNPWPELPSGLERVVAAATLLPALAFFVIGLVLASRRREARIVPLLLPVLAVTVTAMIYWGDARVRAPSDPSMLLVAAYGAVSLVDSSRAARSTSVPPRTD